MKLQQTLGLIRQWAHERNIIDGATSITQFVKLVSEFGEIGEEVFTHRDYSIHNMLTADIRSKFAIKDGIGDCVVVLTIIAAQEGHNAEDIIYGDTYDANGAVVQGEFLNFSASLGKLGDALLKRDIEGIRNFLITSFVCLNALAEAEAVNFEECVDQSYSEIKDRKGIMYNGTFIKSTDSMYDQAVAAVASARLFGEVAE